MFSNQSNNPENRNRWVHNKSERNLSSEPEGKSWREGINGENVPSVMHRRMLRPAENDKSGTYNLKAEQDGTAIMCFSVYSDRTRFGSRRGCRLSWFRRLLE
jgi:hypothetical protein